MSPKYNVNRQENTILENDSRIKSNISISYHRISIEDLMNKINSGCGSEIFRLGKYWSDHSFFQLSINVNKISVYNLCVILMDLLGSKWVSKGNQYYLELSDDKEADRKKWWRVYENSKRSSLQMIATLRESCFNLSSEKVWGYMPTGLKRYISNDFEDVSFYKIRQYISPRSFSNARKLVINRDIADTEFVNSVLNAAYNFQEIDKSTKIDFDRIRISYNQNMAKISLINKARVMDTGNSLDMRGGESIQNEALLQSVFLTLQLNHKNLVEIIKKNKSLGNNERKSLCEFQNKTYWPSNSIKIDSIDSNTDYIPPRRDIVINVLRKRKDFQYISDIYDMYEDLPNAKFLAGLESESSEAIISKYMDSWDVSVKKTENIVLIRNNRWYRDDAIATRSEYCDSILKRVLLLFSLEGNQIGDKTITSFDRLFLEIVVDVFKKINIYQINNSFCFYLPENKYYSSIKDGQMVFPISFISDFIVTNHAFIMLIASLDKNSLGNFLSVGIPINTLNQSQRKNLAGLTDISFPTGEPVINGTKVKLVFGVSTSAGAVDPRIMSMPKRLLIGTYQLEFFD